MPYTVCRSISKKQKNDGFFKQLVGAYGGRSMGKVSSTGVVIKFKISKKEAEKLDDAISDGYGLSRPDLCRQAVKRYLLMLTPPYDTDFETAVINIDSKNAKSYHAYAENGCYKCDITHAICDCITSTKDCRSCVVPIEHRSSTNDVDNEKT